MLRTGQLGRVGLLVQRNTVLWMAMAKRTSNAPHQRKATQNEAGMTTYLHAYSIFDMNVAGATVRGVSTMYATTVGSADATASVIIAPDADQVKISI
jgi:hypothetical protein